LKQTANAFPVPCLISLTKKTKAVTSAHSINSSVLNLRNVSVQNPCRLKLQKHASPATSLTTLTTQPKNVNHVPKIMCITLMRISAGDAHEVRQFSLTKNARNVLETTLTSTFRLKTVQNVPSNKFTIRSQTNANALLKKNISLENNALLASTQNSLIFQTKLANIAQTNKSTTLKSKNAPRAQKISLFSKMTNAPNVLITLTTPSQNSNVNPVHWAEFTVKKSRNVSVRLKSNIGQEMNVLLVSTRDILMSK
jgi:hypothetical protein